MIKICIITQIVDILWNKNDLQCSRKVSQIYLKIIYSLSIWNPGLYARESKQKRRYHQSKAHDLTDVSRSVNVAVINCFITESPLCNYPHSINTMNPFTPTKRHLRLLLLGHRHDYMTFWDKEWSWHGKYIKCSRDGFVLCQI